MVERQPYISYRQRHRTEDRLRTVAGLLLSTPLGLFLLGLMLLLAELPQTGGLQAPPTQVSLVQIPQSQWSQNRQEGDQRQAQARGANAPEAPPAEAAAKPPEPPQPKEMRPPGQIVDVAPTPDDHPPADTQRVSEYNTHVTKEMQAKDKTAFYKNAMPRHTTIKTPNELPGKDTAEKVQAIGQPGLGKEKSARVERRGGAKVEIPDTRKNEQLTLSPGPKGDVPQKSGSEEFKGNSNRLRLQPGEGEAQADDTRHTMGTGGTGARLNLTPSQSILDRIVGAPPSDHLEGVEEGEGTYLNTREWKYAGFFNRVKQSVGERWDPGSVMRRRDPTGEIYGWRDRRTIVAVTLSQQGALEGINVEKSCGVDVLDEEAMQAFRRAQPFPDPPKALLDDNGQVKFSFGFYLEMSSGGLMHLFRGSPN